VRAYVELLFGVLPVRVDEPEQARMRMPALPLRDEPAFDQRTDDRPQSKRRDEDGCDALDPLTFILEKIEGVADNEGGNHGERSKRLSQGPRAAVSSSGPAGGLDRFRREWLEHIEPASERGDLAEVVTTAPIDSNAMHPATVVQSG